MADLLLLLEPLGPPPQSPGLQLATNKKRNPYVIFLRGFPDVFSMGREVERRFGVAVAG